MTPAVEQIARPKRVRRKRIRAKPPRPAALLERRAQALDLQLTRHFLALARGRQATSAHRDAAWAILAAMLGQVREVPELYAVAVADALEHAAMGLATIVDAPGPALIGAYIAWILGALGVPTLSQQDAAPIPGI